MPDCGQALTANGANSPAAIIGEAAHIAGEKPDAARYDQGMTDKQRNDFPNLIYLCPTCHTKIDKQIDDYKVDYLLALKATHENTVAQAIFDGFSSVGFPELEEATTTLTTLKEDIGAPDFRVISPTEKLAKNGLTEKSKFIITSALGIMRQVRNYIETAVETDQSLPTRLKAGFLQEYYRLIQAGLHGDDLFEMMCHFSQRGFREQAKKSAGLAVLVYFFEICEIFEK